MSNRRKGSRSRSERNPDVSRKQWHPALPLGVRWLDCRVCGEPIDVVLADDWNENHRNPMHRVCANSLPDIEGAWVPPLDRNAIMSIIGALRHGYSIGPRAKREIKRALLATARWDREASPYFAPVPGRSRTTAICAMLIIDRWLRTGEWIGLSSVFTALKFGQGR